MQVSYGIRALVTSVVLSREFNVARASQMVLDSGVGAGRLSCQTRVLVAARRVQELSIPSVCQLVAAFSIDCSSSVDM